MPDKINRVPAQINRTQNNVPCGLSAWAQDASVLINGRRQTQQSGQFAAIRREWHSGDKGELYSAYQTVLPS